MSAAIRTGPPSTMRLRSHHVVRSSLGASSAVHRWQGSSECDHTPSGPLHRGCSVRVACWALSGGRHAAFRCRLSSGLRSVLRSSIWRLIIRARPALHVVARLGVPSGARTPSRVRTAGAPPRQAIRGPRRRVHHTSRQPKQSPHWVGRRPRTRPACVDRVEAQVVQ
jgi:hypothetical protein